MLHLHKLTLNVRSFQLHIDKCLDICKYSHFCSFQMKWLSAYHIQNRINTIDFNVITCHYHFQFQTPFRNWNSSTRTFQTEIRRFAFFIIHFIDSPEFLNFFHECWIELNDSFKRIPILYRIKLILFWVLLKEIEYANRINIIIVDFCHKIYSIRFSVVKVKLMP